MGIAVACEGLQIAPAFVMCSSYMCYEVQDGQPVGCRNTPAMDQPLEKLPDFFDAIGADTLIAGTIDDGVKDTLCSHGIQVVEGKSGSPLQAVEDLLSVPQA